MTEFINLHVHTKYSWDCASDIGKLVRHVKNSRQSAVAITDHGSMSGVIKFHKACRDNDLKPILGVEAYICANQKSATEKSPANRRLNHLVLLAKNKTGYLNLLKLTNLANQAERNYYKPRIDEQLLFAHSEGLIVINGHFDTSIHDALCFNIDAASKCDTVEEAEMYLFPDYEQKVLEIVNRYKSVFGDDFYIECQLFDQGDIFQQMVGTVLNRFAQKHGLKAVGTGDAHYIVPEDSKIHKTFVAIKQNKKVKNLPDIGYFNSGTYCLITNEHAQKCYPQNLIDATCEIANKIEVYEITGPQRIPLIADNKTAIAEVRKIAYEKLKELGLHANQTYIDRVEYELEMTERGELANYFLIVRDYLDWARQNGILTGCGRGSVGGALIAYLLGITAIDSVHYDLMWDRFMGPDRIENKVLPDIDSDFQASRRDEVIDYIRHKYGDDKVCGVVTFGLLQGKSAIKTVLSAWDVCDPKQQKDISDCIQGKDKISDKLAEFASETGSDSIILYTLTHEPESLANYVRLQDGQIVGEWAPFFELAIALEGAIKTESKHASAIIISGDPVANFAPLSKDKSSDNLLCAFDMYSFETAGLVKFDILGLKSLDGLFEVNNLIKDMDIGKYGTIFED